VSIIAKSSASPNGQPFGANEMDHEEHTTDELAGENGHVNVTDLGDDSPSLHPNHQTQSPASAPGIFPQLSAR